MQSKRALSKAKLHSGYFCVLKPLERQGGILRDKVIGMAGAGRWYCEHLRIQRCARLEL